MEGYRGLSVYRNSMGFIEVTPESPGSRRDQSLPYMGSTENATQAKIFYHILRDLVKRGYEFHIVEKKTKCKEYVKYGVDDVTRKIIDNAVENRGFPDDLYQE